MIFVLKIKLYVDIIPRCWKIYCIIVQCFCYRFYAIVCPLSSGKAVRNMKILLASAWIISILCASPQVSIFTFLFKWIQVVKVRKVELVIILQKLMVNIFLYIEISYEKNFKWTSIIIQTQIYEAKDEIRWKLVNIWHNPGICDWQFGYQYWHFIKE